MIFYQPKAPEFQGKTGFSYKPWEKETLSKYQVFKIRKFPLSIVVFFILGCHPAAVSPNFLRSFAFCECVYVRVFLLAYFMHCFYRVF